MEKKTLEKSSQPISSIAQLIKPSTFALVLLLCASHLGNTTPHNN